MFSLKPEHAEEFELNAEEFRDYLDFHIVEQYDVGDKIQHGKNFTVHTCNETDIENYWDFTSEEITLEQTKA